MNIKLEIIFFVSILVFVLIYAFWMFNTEKRLKRFFKGTKGRDLEDSIINLEENIKKLTQAKENIEKELESVNAKLKKRLGWIPEIKPEDGMKDLYKWIKQNRNLLGKMFSK